MLSVYTVLFNHDADDTGVKLEAGLHTEEAVGQDAVMFNSIEEAKGEMKLRGFQVKETTNKFVRYTCTSCAAVPFRLRLAAAGDGVWRCCPSEHCDGCPHKIHEQDGIRIVQYKHEMAKFPGLLDFIECLGATGEMRTDQLFRSVKAKFNVHVESQLLYRTARAAHEDMFGTNVSDVSELLELGERIKSEGGTFRLVLGSSCCVKYVWAFGTCFQCTRFAIFHVVYGTCFQCTRFAIFHVSPSTRFVQP